MRLLFPLLLLSSLCLAQTRRVIVLPIGTDMSSNIKYTISDVNAKVVEIERPGGGDIKVSGLLDFKGKVLKVGKGTKITGGTISNAVIDVPYNQPILSINSKIENIKSVTGEFSVGWFEDLPDDTQAFQKAVDACTEYKGIGVVRVPYGRYSVSKGIVLTSSGYTSISIRGDVPAYDNGAIGAASFIEFTGKEGFFINVQKGKGCVIENLVIYGQNRLNLSPAEVVDDKTQWILPGIIDSSLKPYCAIAVDYFPSTVNSGSTDITIRNCAIRYFAVGIAISPNGTTQNAEIIKTKDCWIDYSRVCVSTGNSQTRSVLLEGLYGWGNIEVVADSERYGGGGALPEIRGGNFAGSVKYLFRTSNVGLPMSYHSGIYAEELYAIGGRFYPGGANMQFTFVGCNLNFMGGNHCPTVLVRCNQLNIIGGQWTYYSASNFQPMPIDCAITTVTGVALYGVLWDINYNPIIYQNTKIHSLYNSPLNSNGQTNYAGIEDGRMVPAEGTYVYAPGQKRTYSDGPLVTVGFVDGNITISKDHISFNIPNTSVFPGDFVMIQGYGGRTYSDSSTGAIGTFLLGRVNGIDQFDNAIVSNIPPNMNLSAGKFRFTVMIYMRVYKTHIGDIQKGSSIIKNIVGEGNSVSQKLDVGDIIAHSAFPATTRIIWVNSGEVTVNNIANRSELSAAITATDYTAETKSNPEKVLSNDFKVAWKKGDRIINDFSDPRYDGIKEWICIKSGIVRSGNLPIFK